MPDPGYTPADLELFGDLERAAEAVGVTPCLIGAGVIKLGANLRWGIRLARRTRDWDFAVRVRTWLEFKALTDELVSARCRFRQAQEPHRFLHGSGGTLDVVPYGSLEDPPGTMQWSDGARMDTTGLRVLDEHHECHELGHLSLRTASLPALLGLKFLTYGSRRSRTIRDIGDAYGILLDAEGFMDDRRVAQEALARLESAEVEYGEVGAYLAGLDVGRVFEQASRAGILDVLAELDTPATVIVNDIERTERGRNQQRDLIFARLRAFRLGIRDR